MLKRIRMQGDEQDCFSRWRSLLCSFDRADAVKSIKKGYRRRFRRKAKKELENLVRDVQV